MTLRIPSSRCSIRWSATRPRRWLAIFEVLIEEEGLALRGTFVIDPAGKIKIMEVHDNGIGPRREGTAAQSKKPPSTFAAHPGEVCPAKWTPGAETLSPSLDLVGKI